MATNSKQQKAKQADKMCEAYAKVHAQLTDKVLNSKATEFNQKSEDERKNIQTDAKLVRFASKDAQAQFLAGVQAGVVNWAPLATTKAKKTGFHLIVTADKAKLATALGIVYGYAQAMSRATTSGVVPQGDSDRSAIVDAVNKAMATVKDADLIRDASDKVVPFRLNVCIQPDKEDWVSIEPSGAYAHSNAIMTLLKAFNEQFA